MLELGLISQVNTKTLLEYNVLLQHQRGNPATLILKLRIGSSYVAPSSPRTNTCYDF